MSLLTPPLVKAPVLVLAVGNPSRGDDAVGPLLAECLQAWLRQQPAEVQARIEVITDQQLVVEHVLDIQGRERVLLMDAAAQGEQLVLMRELQTTRPQGAGSSLNAPYPLPSPDEHTAAATSSDTGPAPTSAQLPAVLAEAASGPASGPASESAYAAPISSHAATPSQLLSWHGSLLGQTPPPTSLLTITGRGFELGAGLSDQARRGLREAWPHLLAWLQAQPSACQA
jgi:hypothetical protein